MNKKIPEIVLPPLEVTLDECGGDFNKMLRKFIRKVKKEEVLKEYLIKTSYFESKSRKKRNKMRKGTYEFKKRQQKEQED